MTRQSRAAWKVLPAVVVLAACVHAQQFSAWSAPVNLGSVVNSAFDEERPAISKDGLSLFFSSTRPGGFGGSDLWVSLRAGLDAPWGPPVNLGPNINTTGNESAPNLSNDGHYLFFHRPGGCGDLDLHVARRRDGRNDLGWEPAINLDLFGREPGSRLICTVNTAFKNAGPNYFQDETTGLVTLYFTSTRPAPRVGFGDFDIWVSSQKPDGTFGPAVFVEQLNSASRDTRTAIRRRDGLELYLVSERAPGKIGDANLWVSTRPDTTSPFSWSTPVLLDQAPLAPGELPVNMIGIFDGAMALSWDGTELYFHSNRPVVGYGGHDLYVAKRHKISSNNP